MTRNSFRRQERSTTRRFQELPTTEEIMKLLSYARRMPNTRDFRDVVRIIVSTGLRMRELAALRWEHIDFSSPAIVVDSDLTKTQRRVPLTAAAMRILRIRRRLQPESEYVLGESPDIVLHRVLSQLRTFCERLGIRQISLNSLRHVFAIRWLTGGGDMLALASILGFRAISTVFRSFVAPTERSRTDAQEFARIEATMS